MNILDAEYLDKRLSPSVKKKKYLGIHFACCNVYTRIYVNNVGNAYKGRCPHCLRRLSVKIGKNGVKDRFLVAF